jgi:ATP-dependent DNA ligase
LITRGGYDWTKRFPWIAEAAPKNRQKRFVIDGEAVILGVDGISDFDALHSSRHNDEVQLCAFDILMEGGTICASCRYRWVRPTLNGSWHAAPKASS